VGPDGHQQRAQETEACGVVEPAAARGAGPGWLCDGRRATRPGVFLWQSVAGCDVRDGVVHRTAPPVNRSAASAPEIMTVGTPTPGTVVDPASTRFAG